ncbi:hypothetical protein [Kitasatospora sp. NPDC088134]|uniref:hypothetical protein n=1 Tax=Kitasatospora sp. NPDC088134 TaxID=3364071 RepID=UPI00382A6492
MSGRPAAATGSWDGTVRLWNPLTAQLLAPPLHFPAQVHAVALTPTGHLAVAAGPDLFLVPSPTTEPGPRA